MNQAKDTSRQQLFIMLFIAIVLVFFYAVKSVLLPFIAGMVVAYVMNPLTNRFVRWRLHRGVASALALVIFFGVAISAIFLIAPLLKAQLVEFSQRLPEYIERMKQAFAPLQEYVNQQLLNESNSQKLEQLVSAKGESVIRWSVNVLGRLVSGGMAFANVLSLIFITPIVAFYLLRDFNKFTGRAEELVPREHIKTVKEQLAEVNKTLAGFMRGQATVCLILGTYFGVALSLIGLEFGLVIGLFAGLLAFLPYVGSTIGLLLCVGLGYVQYDGDLHQLFIIALVYGLGQFFEGNFLTPYLVGGRVGLHPVWIIFALLAGGALFGLGGVLVAVPVAAVVGVLVRFAVQNYLNSDFYLAHSGKKKGQKKTVAKRRRKRS